MSKEIQITIGDVLTVQEGHPCPLKMLLSKKSLKKNVQYYSLRYNYCLKMFNVMYSDSEEWDEDEQEVPDSIKDYWEDCIKVLKRLEEEVGLEITKVDIEIDDTNLGGKTIIQAIGSIDGNEKCIFNLIFGSRWSKKHGYRLVKELDYGASALGWTENEATLYGLLLGKSDPSEKITKLYREIPKNDVLKKSGEVKTKGWEKLKEDYAKAIAETKTLFQDKRPLMEIPTEPNPLNCGSCPFHNHPMNIKKGDSFKSVICTGFIHEI